MRGQKENLELSPQQKVDYSNELEETEKELIRLKNDLFLVKQLADKVWKMNFKFFIYRNLKWY